MKVFKKTLSVILAILMVLAVTPLTFAAVDTSIIALGDVVTFGIYEQDGDAETQDALEWIVVGKDGNALKLITKYIINTKRTFSVKTGNVGAWGTNNDIYANFIPGFLSDVDFYGNPNFTEKEKAAIIPVDNGAVDQSGAALGADLVYIPSSTDINEIFATDAERIATNTAVAASEKKATPVGEPAQYYLRDTGYQVNVRNSYASYVDATGAVHIASADDKTMTTMTLGSVGIRVMTNVDISKLHTTGKDAETGIIPLVGTLGTHKVVWQCKCIDADGNEVTYTYTFLNDKYLPVDHQMIDHGDAATPPDERDIISHSSNYHQGYEFVGWDQEYDSVTSEMVITAVYEEIPEVGLFEQIFNWIRSLFVLLISIIETEVLPVINEWLEANLGFEITW